MTARSAALLLLAIAALAVFAGACDLQRRVMYPRPHAGPAPPLPAGASRIELGPAADWEALLLRPSETRERFGVVIYTHGNAELIDHWIESFGELTRAGFGVLLVEYPGYGRSGGAPTQQSITQAVVAAYDFVAAHPEVDPSRVVAYGRSLGGGAACALARERRLAGLILESSFTSVRDLAWRYGMPGLLVVDPFDSVAALAEIDLPVLVMHGERDGLIPVAHGEALARAAGVDLVRLPCGHNDCRRPWSEVIAFLRGGR